MLATEPLAHHRLARPEQVQGESESASRGFEIGLHGPHSIPIRLPFLGIPSGSAGDTHATMMSMRDAPPAARRASDLAEAAGVAAAARPLARPNAPALALLALGHMVIDINRDALPALLPFLKSKFALSGAPGDPGARRRHAARRLRHRPVPPRAPGLSPRLPAFAEGGVRRLAALSSMSMPTDQGDPNVRVG